MKPFDLWKKMVNGKIYTQEAVTTRINTVFAVGQLTEVEYSELINLINTVY